MKALLLTFLTIMFILPTGLKAQSSPDALVLVRLKEVQIRDTRKWSNDTLRYQFNQTRYYVQTVLPYLEHATTLFNEINADVHNSSLSPRQRKRLINAKEDLIRNRFEAKVKALNETQGILLVKLIARQTGVNIYSMLKEFKNPLTAVKWQTWARLNGFNLNKRYEPDEEILLEQVMLSLDYPLPHFYEHKETATALIK